MNKRLIIFEDDKTANLNPLVRIRPGWCLRPGIRPLYMRIGDTFQDYELHPVCRPEVAPLAADLCLRPVNEKIDKDIQELLIVNGLLRDRQKLADSLAEVDGNVYVTSGERLVAVRLSGPLDKPVLELINGGNFLGLIDGGGCGLDRIEGSFSCYNYLWDFVADIDAAIVDDIGYLRQARRGLFAGPLSENLPSKYPDVHFINENDILIAPDVEIMPTAVLDASDGPVYIESGVVVEPYTLLKGPAYIGRETRLVGGKISGCSLGPVCRIGGEVEETIIHGYTNKYHAGFLGHAYLGEWINLGAMTTNSDLKNNYSPVRVAVGGEMVDSGQVKVGSFIGDFTKTAIGTLLNTGINIGIGCNILGGGLAAEKEIADFTWYLSSGSSRFDLKKALEVIERSMARRGVTLSAALRNRLQAIYTG